MKQRVQRALVPRLRAGSRAHRRGDTSDVTLVHRQPRSLERRRPDHPAACHRPAAPPGRPRGRRCSATRATPCSFPTRASTAVVAMQGAPGRVEFRGKPMWVEGHYDAGVNSIWDLGEVHVRFASAAVLQEVGRQGQLGGGLVDGACGGPRAGRQRRRLQRPDDAARRGSPGCSGFRAAEGRRPAGRALPAQGPGAGQQGRDPQPQAPREHPGQPAPGQCVRGRAAQLPRARDRPRPRRQRRRRRLRTARRGRLDARPAHSLRYQFLNIDGRWWFFGVYQLDECA